MGLGYWTCPDCGERVETTAHTCGGMHAKVVDPRDAELAALQARVAESEARASAFSKQQVTLVNEATVRRARVAELEAKLAESEAQRAVLVAALEDLIARADEADRLLPYGHGLRTLPARQALASQPPSDLVALVKAAATWRDAARKQLDGHAPAVLMAALDTLFQNQPAFRALIESEGV